MSANGRWNGVWRLLMFPLGSTMMILGASALVYLADRFVIQHLPSLAVVIQSTI
jgi:hypothetical protein